MDPNTTLVVIRELIKQIYQLDSWDVTGSTKGDFKTVKQITGEQAELAIDLAELVSAMDQWLSKGGFLPSAWHFARR